MANMIIDIVKATSGIDLSECDDSFPCLDGCVCWFVGVTHDGVKYRTVKVIGNAIEFYVNHPTTQKVPNIRITLGVVGKEYPLTPPPALSTRSKTETETAAKTLVEFKGKHTRFPDSDEDEDKGAPLDKDILFYCANPKEWTKKLEDKVAVFEKGESSSNISGMMGLKIYENKRRKLLRVESVGDLIARKIDNHLRKEMHAVKSDMTMGSRGDLTFTFQTSSMDCIPEMKTLTEFIVDGCTYYYMRLV
jgi:hypothetical protein